MPKKFFPEIRVNAYPQKYINSLTLNPIVVADEFADLIQRDAGDGGAVNQDQQKPETWTGTQGLTIPENVRVVQFSGGTVKEGATAAAASDEKAITGLCLQPHEYPVNCVLFQEDPAENNALPKFRPKGDPKFESLEWKALDKVVDDYGQTLWDIVLADEPPTATRLFHARLQPDTLFMATTTEPVYKDIGFHLKLTALQPIKGTSPGKLRFVWGGGAYALVFRENASPTVERKRRSKGGQQSSGGAAWEIWRELTELPVTKFDEAIDIWVEQLAGRLSLVINGTRFNLIESQPIFGAAEKGLQQTTEPAVITWPEGNMVFYQWNVSAVLGLSFVRYTTPPVYDPAPANADPDEPPPIHTPEAPLQVTIGRIRHRKGMDTEHVEGKPPKLQGWRPAGTKVKTSLEAEHDEIKYSIDVKADSDGHYTPFLTGITGYIAGNFNHLGMDALNITPAVTDWEFSGSEPGIATSAELKLTLQRDVLDALTLPGDTPTGLDWRYYLDTNRYNPLEFSVRWHYEDGSVDSTWAGLFNGFAWEVNKDLPEFGDAMMSVTARDKTIRFKEPAGILDDRIPPLTTIIKQDKSLFVADCIQEIIRLILGDGEAALMNGNGNARAYLPDDHLPLFSYTNDVYGFYEFANKPPVAGGLMLRPPYLRDAASWIADFAKDDAFGEDLVAFFYGFPDPDHLPEFGLVWPVPIYGFLDVILSYRKRWQITDTVYADWPQGLILGSAGVQARPDKDYNAVITVNSPSGFNKESYPGPGLFVGHAQLDKSDPNSADFSWERTAVRENNSDYMGEEDVQNMANAYILSFAGSGAIAVNLELTCGEAYLQWGDLLQPVFAKFRGGPDNPDNLVSDTTLNLNGQWFRATKVRHHGNQQTREFKTSIMAYMLSNVERGQMDPPA